MSETLRLRLLQLIPLVVFLVFWETAVRLNEKLIFFFGSPTKVASYMWTNISNGRLITDTSVTLLEAVSGFLIGNIIGTAAGLALWYSRTAFLVARPYVIALGSAPIFALAPLVIIWFGTGILSKIMIAAFSTVFIALSQSYTGANEVQSQYLRLMQALGATKHQTFRKLIAPSALVWVISAFKLNVGFALLGAIIGEFISSNEGLGHLILVASGLFDISLVLCGITMLILIALVLNTVIAQIEKPLLHVVAKYF